MRYANMEEAAGQYLAKMLKDSDVKIKETPNFGDYYYCNTAITAMTSVERKIIITPRLSLEPQPPNVDYIKFRGAMEIIARIKVICAIKRSDMIPIENEFDEAVMAEILIHAVRERYIKKAAVIDLLAQIDKPRMIAEFLNETQEIDEKEDFKL